MVSTASSPLAVCQRPSPVMSGSDRFSAEQQPGECFGVGERTGRRVEPDERRLGVGDIGCDIPVEHEPPTNKGVGDIDFVVTGAAIAACLAALNTRPAPSFQSCHPDPHIQGYIEILNISLSSSRLEGAHAYSIVGWLQADIRRRELAPTEGADAPPRPPPADFSPREETWYEAAVVRKRVRQVVSGALVLSARTSLPGFTTHRRFNRILRV